MALAFCLSLGMHESRPSRFLKRTVSLIRYETEHDLRVNNPDHVPSVPAFLITALIRPIRLFRTEPIVFSVAIMSSFVFALIYLFAEAFPIVYRSSPFDFSLRQSSLVFVAIALGLIPAIPLRIYDRGKAAARKNMDKSPSPEDKLMGFYVAAPTLAIALWWFAWTIPPLVLPLALVGFCTNESDTILAGYLTDSYTIYAASANAPLAFLRAVLSAVFPLFAEHMFTSLGANVASLILAALATLFCVRPSYLQNTGGH